jgi:hypothetical protein
MKTNPKTAAIFAAGVVGISTLLGGCQMDTQPIGNECPAPESEQNLVGEMIFERENGMPASIALTMTRSYGEDMLAIVVPFGRDMRNLKNVRIIYSDRFRKMVGDRGEHMKKKYNINGPEFGFVSIEIERNADYIDFPGSKTFLAMISPSDAGLIYQAVRRGLNMEGFSFVTTGSLIGNDLYYVEYPTLDLARSAAAAKPRQTKAEQDALLEAAGIKRSGLVSSARKNLPVASRAAISSITGRSR